MPIPCCLGKARAVSLSSTAGLPGSCGAEGNNEKGSLEQQGQSAPFPIAALGHSRGDNAAPPPPSHPCGVQILQEKPRLLPRAGNSLKQGTACGDVGKGHHPLWGWRERGWGVRGTAVSSGTTRAGGATLGLLHTDILAFILKKSVSFFPQKILLLWCISEK